MTEWRLKRFWTAARVTETEQGYDVFLDGRPVKTPAKRPLRLPTVALAEAVAAEWDAQPETVDPLSMPMTRSANAALDKVADQFDEVAEMLAAYGETDLLCHRAESPDALIQEQADAWDPLLDWARSALHAPLTPVFGVMAEPQPEASLANLRARLKSEDIFALTALHDLVSMSGSVIIGLAAVDGVLPAEELWRRSRIDETWQERQWGVDEEAAAFATRKRAEFMHAAEFHRLSRPIA